MDILTNLFSGLFKQAEGILDTTITNKEELQIVKNELERILNDAEKECTNSSHRQMEIRHAVRQ